MDGSDLVIWRELTAGVAFVWRPYSEVVEAYWSDAMAIRGPVLPGVNPDPARPFHEFPVPLLPGETLSREQLRQISLGWLQRNRSFLGGFLESSLYG